MILESVKLTVNIGHHTTSIFETGSCCGAPSKLALKSGSSRLSLWSAEIIGIYHHIWLLFDAFTGNMVLYDIAGHLRGFSFFAVTVKAPVYPLLCTP